VEIKKTEVEYSGFSSDRINLLPFKKTEVEISPGAG
jgi:hypothetical protein